MILVGLLLFAEITQLLGGTDDNATTPHWKIAVLILLPPLHCGSFVFWSVLFLSQLHLAADASERMTMVQTYLSLQESGRTFKDEDIRLVLNALFRPTSDGLIKNDALPPGIVERISRTDK